MLEMNFIKVKSYPWENNISFVYVIKLYNIVERNYLQIIYSISGTGVTDFKM